MKRFLIKLVESGEREKYHEVENNSIKIANFIGVLFTLVIGIPMTIITAIYIPDLVWVPIGGTAMFMMVIPFNIAEMTRLSRVILSLAPQSLANVYTAFILEPGQDLPQSLTMIISCFVVMPFVLFEWKERHFSIILAAVGATMLILQPFYCGWLSLMDPVDFSIFEHGPLRVFVSFLGFSCIGGMFLTLVYRNSVLENKWN